MTITTVIRSDLFRHTDFTSHEAATIAEHIMACKDMGYISESEIPKLAEKMAETHALVPYEPEPIEEIIDTNAVSVIKPILDYPSSQVYVNAVRHALITMGIWGSIQDQDKFEQELQDAYALAASARLELAGEAS